MAVLQNPGDHIKAWIENAAKAEQRVAEVTDPALTADYPALAGPWAATSVLQIK
jgi:hypothetical protein